MTHCKRVLKYCYCAAITLLLAGCGGGGGQSNDTNVTSGNGLPIAPSSPLLPPSLSPPSSWQPGVFEPSRIFKSFCASPRSGQSTITGANFDDMVGDVADENHWLRSWSNETYLWYDEIIDQDPNLFSTPEYFESLKTNAIRPSGRDRDEFHFSVPTDEWEALSQSGVSVSYGAHLVTLNSSIPRDIRIGYVEPNSPASNAGLARGDRFLTVDGVSVDTNTQAGVNTLNAGLVPQNNNESHQFSLRSLDNRIKNVVLRATEVVQQPVLDTRVIPSSNGNIGYMVFNAHISIAETQLITAISQFQNSNLSELILDLRYNGGGLLFMASQLSYMIAGPNATNGRVFEQLNFNDKHPIFNPITGQPNTPIPFVTTGLGFASPQVIEQALPTLNLNRLYVLTSNNTCSASESIINSLRGIDIEVIQIGDTTCGKPYGFFAQDNCGTTYFTVQFQNTNDKGFGDYADGFSPANNNTSIGAVTLPGCSVREDLLHPLGDVNERLLGSALHHISTGQCLNNAFSISQKTQNTAKTSPQGLELNITSRNPWLNNRILQGPQ